jgi:hypothetical protein
VSRTVEEVSTQLEAVELVDRYLAAGYTAQEMYDAALAVLKEESQK